MRTSAALFFPCGRDANRPALRRYAIGNFM